MPEWLIQIIVPASVSLTVIGAGYLANRRLGIASGQQSLVSTLQGEVDALKTRDARLEREFQACKLRLEHVEQENSDLKDEVFELRTEMSKLMVKRQRSTRTRASD